MPQVQLAAMAAAPTLLIQLLLMGIVWLVVVGRAALFGLMAPTQNMAAAAVVQETTQEPVPKEEVPYLVPQAVVVVDMVVALPLLEVRVAHGVLMS